MTELSPAQEQLRDQARQLAITELAPQAAEWDEQEIFPERSYQLLREHGLTGLCIPAAYGGRGLGVFEACLVLEQIAYGCMSTAIALQFNLNGPSRVIARIGTEDQKARYLPGVADGSRVLVVAMTEPQAGSDGLALSTTLRPDGDRYRLSGTKCHITLGARADTALVFCRAEGTRGPNGIGAVLVDKGAPGFTVTEVEAKMGGRGAAEAVLSFEDVVVDPADVVMRPDPDSREGAAFLLVQFNPERCGNAAMCIGVAQAAFDFAVQYAREREQFGLPVAEFQGIAWKFADMAVDLEAARLLMWQAARSDAGGFPAMRETAMAKLAANEAAVRVCDQAIQILGHKGYLRRNPVERFYRDVRGMGIGGGTTEILRNIIASEVTGVRVSQRRPA